VGGRCNPRRQTERSRGSYRHGNAGNQTVAHLRSQSPFRCNDDAHWADLAFDDSSWPLLRSDSGWSSQGKSAWSGFGWYRFSIRVPSGSKPLALDFPKFLTGYEIYVDGHLQGVANCRRTGSC
jgi:hypothetical protein